MNALHLLLHMGQLNVSVLWLCLLCWYSLLSQSNLDSRWSQFVSLGCQNIFLFARFQMFFQVIFSWECLWTENTQQCFCFVNCVDMLFKIFFSLKVIRTDITVKFITPCMSFFRDFSSIVWQGKFCCNYCIYSFQFHGQNKCVLSVLGAEQTPFHILDRCFQKPSWRLAETNI